MSKKTKRKLVCPKTFRGKKVRSVKGVCMVTLASGKKKRVKKIAAAPASVSRAASRRGMTTTAYKKKYGPRSKPDYSDRLRSGETHAERFSRDVGAAYMVGGTMPNGSYVETMAFDKDDLHRTEQALRADGVFNIKVRTL